MIPDQLDSLAEYSSPVVRDTDVVIAIARPDLETNSYLSQLYAFSGEKPIRISHNWHDSAPVVTSGWSGFLSAPRKEAAQLYAGPTLETTHRITDHHLGVSEFAIDEQGARAVYVARIGEPERYGADEDVSAAEEPPRRITSATYLSNGIGYIRDRPARAFVVDLVDPGLGKTGVEGSGEVHQSALLANPESDVHDPQFSPGGHRISVISAVEPDRGHPDLRTTVWLLGTDAPQAVELPRLSVQLHRWIDDDTLLLIAADLTAHELDFVAQMPGLYVHSLATGETRRLTDPETVAVAQIPPVIVGRAQHGSGAGGSRRNGGADRDSVVAVIETDGAARLARIPLAAENLPLDDLEYFTDATTVVNGFDVDGDAVVFTAVTPQSPAVAARIPLSAGTAAPAILQDHPAPSGFVLPEVVRVEGEGGTVTGCLAKPAGEGPFPVVLNIHGGPFSQYTHGWFDETQVLTSAGYAVVYANPRGSNGRTRAWGKAVQGNMAEPAMRDVLAVLDHVLAANPDLDGTRLGVQGGSYGGFLTAMIIAHEHRFRAAIVERGFLDPRSFIGTSDIGRYFAEEYTSRDAAAIERQSPLAHTAKVRTPTLVMHSELDFRCPLEQAQQYYAALQRAGVKTELLVFPGENHELSRSGQPRHRKQRFDAILEWWERHLGGSRSPAPATVVEELGEELDELDPELLPEAAVPTGVALGARSSDPDVAPGVEAAGAGSATPTVR